MAYSVDLRVKVLKYIKAGHNRLEASNIFGVSLRTIVRWLSMERAGNLSDPKPKRPWKKINKNILMTTVEKNPGYRLSDFANIFQVSTAAICQAFKLLKITRKKRPIYTNSATKQSGSYFWQISQNTKQKT